jgi:hypothetical protein
MSLVSTSDSSIYWLFKMASKMASETENMHISWPVIDILSQFLGPDMDF